MGKPICAIEGCEKPVHSSAGWCKVHYSRWRRTGNPLGREAVSVDERFWSRVVLGDPPKIRPELGACWLWTGANSKGYGYFVPHGHQAHQAYRWIYKRLVSDEIDGLDLDHLCRNPPCVNPWHLEPVSHRENMRRGDNAQRRKTHCPHGHEYAGANLYITPAGTRQCRICRKNRRERAMRSAA